MKTLAIIGSTGSIGKSALKVLDKNKKKFNLIYLTCNKNFNLLNMQINKYNPNFFHINKSDFQYKSIKKSKFKPIDYFIKKKKKIDFVISGIAGFESINYNFALLKVAKNLLLANKETIICGGDVFLNEAKKNKCNLLPVDSEHYCINYFLKKFNHTFFDIKKIILTASGGPFLNKNFSYKEKLNNVLDHPNWKMGKKISVDSSTMSNKVLELFEAKILFKIPRNKIDILIEKNSIVHSIIVMKNNVNFYIAHKTSMEIPISNSLNCQNKHDLKIQNHLIKFQKVNFKKFPIAKLGFRILNYGNAGMILFTVINQRLVELFLNKKIYYGDIMNKLIDIFKKNEIVKMSKKCIKNKSDIFDLMEFAKKVKL